MEATNSCIWSDILANIVSLAFIKKLDSYSQPTHCINIPIQANGVVFFLDIHWSALYERGCSCECNSQHNSRVSSCYQSTSIQKCDCNWKSCKPKLLPNGEVVKSLKLPFVKYEAVSHQMVWGPKYAIWGDLYLADGALGFRKLSQFFNHDQFSDWIYLNFG